MLGKPPPIFPRDGGEKKEGISQISIISLAIKVLPSLVPIVATHTHPYPQDASRFQTQGYCFFFFQKEKKKVAQRRGEEGS